MNDLLQNSAQISTAPDAADCSSPAAPLPAENGANWTDTFISDFNDPLFRSAFQQYFAELDITVENWDEIFREMNDGKTFAFVRTHSDSGEIIGFILFSPIVFNSWFFEQTCGFIREFWIAENQRSCGHGSALLCLAEQYFAAQGFFTSILTTDTAPVFYTKNGYTLLQDCHAKNDVEVFAKRLSLNDKLQLHFALH